MIRCIDLNADLGEDESTEGIDRDLAMMDIVSSCNIACGGHAGSVENMRTMLLAAKVKGVQAGAHPSYPDRANFGRVSMTMPMEELKRSLEKQVATFKGAASQTGTTIHHLKPHGALYNDAQDNVDLAELLVDLARTEELIIVGMAGASVHYRADVAGVPFVAEAFIDRRYRPDQRLVPRSEKDAVLSSQADRLAQGLALATGESIMAANGQTIAVNAQTLCLHSDSDGALATAQSMRTALEKSGVTIRAATP